MELTNCIYKFSDKHPEDKDLSKLVFSYLTRGLYPYCPHLASEVWGLTYQGDINQATEDYSALREKVKLGVTVTV